MFYYVLKQKKKKNILKWALQFMMYNTHEWNFLTDIIDLKLESHKISISKFVNLFD